MLYPAFDGSPMTITDKETDMQLNLARFKDRYEQLVEESLPDYRAGKMQEIVLKYPFVISEDVPWTPLPPSRQ